MSITNGAENAEGESPNCANGWLDGVGNIIRTLRFPYREILSEHAAHKQHEDVPEDAVKSPEGGYSWAVHALDPHSVELVFLAFLPKWTSA